MFRTLKKIILGHSYYLNESYSQLGEDIIIDHLLPNIKNGFYIDVGAHHPYRFSNTFGFYKKGWRGINIDPIPGIKKLFDRKRSKDINLEIGIGLNVGSFIYYDFKERAYNTFDKNIAKKLINNNTSLLKNKILIPINTLENILDKNLPKNKEIDFLNIDVEGLDFQVLQSNNWKKYKPQLICCETHTTIINILDSKVYKFLLKQGYKCVAHNTFTSFFIRV